MEAPIRLFRHLSAMKEELVESENLSSAKEMVEGLRFEAFEEKVCAVQYKGIKKCDPAIKDPDDPEKYPYVKIVNDTCRHYKLSDDLKEQLCNAKLVEESTLLNCDFKFDSG